mgnify:CR=1 FL=1
MQLNALGHVVATKPEREAILAQRRGKRQKNGKKSSVVDNNSSHILSAAKEIT